MFIRFGGLAPAMTPAKLTLGRTMADETVVQKSGPGWGMFQWIVGGLVAVIAVLVGVIYNDMRSSIKETAEGLSTFKIEVVRQFGDVKSEIAAVRTDVAAVKTDVAAVKTDVAAVKTDVAALKTDVAALKTEVATTNAKLDKVIDRLDRLKSR
jgi:septal ring factor EnvC (AmiA/AmiB activator)